jgi:hypothetical protein
VLSDAQQKGGEAYAYRLRVSPPQPGFDLRVVPSRIAMKSKESATVTVHAIRKDGFTGPIRFQIKDAECGFTVQGNPVLSGTQTVMRVTIKTSLAETDEPLPIMIQGVSTTDRNARARRRARRGLHAGVPVAAPRARAGAGGFRLSAECRTERLQAPQTS